MLLTRRQIKTAEEFIQHGEEFKDLFPQYADLIDHINQETMLEIEESTVVDECFTFGCCRAAMHTLRYGAKMCHYCCKCYVRAGFTPDDWHPECTAAYAARHAPKVLTAVM